MSPPPDDEAGDVLYCTITLMLFDGFASSGCRSREILELSARAGTALTHKTRHSAMLRFDKVRMAALGNQAARVRDQPEHEKSGTFLNENRKTPRPVPA